MEYAFPFFETLRAIDFNDIVDRESSRSVTVHHVV